MTKYITMSPHDCVKVVAAKALVRLIQDHGGDSSEVAKVAARQYWIIDEIMEGVERREMGISPEKGKPFEEDEANSGDDDSEDEEISDDPNNRNFAARKVKDEVARVHPSVIPLERTRNVREMLWRAIGRGAGERQ